MPDTDFNLRTELDSFSKVLIIDEEGELPTLLVDNLLSHGCLVNYFGKESKDSFDYLSGKSNFIYLESLNKETNLGQFNYLYYFPGDHYSKLEEVTYLLEGTSHKALICSSLFSLRKDIFQGWQEKGLIDFRIATFDCVFGQRIKSSFLGQLFRVAVEDNQVKIDGDSSEEIYPVPEKDLAKELVRIIFSPDTESKQYFIRPKHKISLLDLASGMRNYLPDLTVSFSGRKNERHLETSGMEKVEIDYSLEEKLEETIEWLQRSVVRVEPRQDLPKVEKVETVETVEIAVPPPVLETVKIIEEVKEEQVEPPVNPVAETNLDYLFDKNNPKVSQKPSGKKSLTGKLILAFSIFFLLLFLFFIVPMGLSFAAGSLGVRKVISVKSQIDKGNFSSAITEAGQAKKYIDFSNKVMTISGPFYSLIGFSKQVSTIMEAFPFSENLISSLQFSLSAAKQAIEIEKNFLSDKEVNWSDSIGAIKADFSSAYEQASLAQASLDNVQPTFKFLQKMAYFDKIKSVLPQAREVLLKAEKMTAILPKFLGVGNMKSYLVLFQNNMEIRPTGGFIGSYGIVRLENGKLINFEVFDVYQADGQLKGHVEPPETLKKYLGEPTWYLRDSNWDPDFPISAKRAEWFLDKEMQITVDGTIAINLEVVKKLLQAIGEVNVPDYNEKVTADNLFQKAEYYSELGTFPGSTQKKDFISSLTQVIFERIKQANSKELVNVAGGIFSSLEEKEMMIYSDDPEVQSAIARLEWEGSIRNYTPVVAGDSVYLDYLSINEANVGINKANYFMQRKIDHQINVSKEGNVQEKLTLTYENLSPSDNWPAGRYRNYLRIYLPIGTNLNSAFIDDPANPGLWLPFDSNSMDMTAEHGKTIFGFVFEVPIKSQRKIEINYELQQPIALSSKITSYLLMVQKQSGAPLSNYDLTFTYPPTFIPLRVIPSALTGDQQLLITNKLSKDLIYQIDLAH